MDLYNETECSGTTIEVILKPADLMPCGVAESLGAVKKNSCGVSCY